MSDGARRLGTECGRPHVQASSRNICHPMVKLVWLAGALVQYISRGEKEMRRLRTHATAYYAVLYICRAVCFEAGDCLPASREAGKFHGEHLERTLHSMLLWIISSDNGR